MPSLPVTDKIQIVVPAAEKVLLDGKLHAYRDTCSFETHKLKQLALHDALYRSIREKWGPKSRMAQSVTKTVTAHYRTILENQGEWIQSSFKKPPYDLVVYRRHSQRRTRSTRFSSLRT